MDENSNAERISWEAPGGVQMTIVPEPGGFLRVEVANGVVTVAGKDCRHLQGEYAKNPKDVMQQILSEVTLAIITDQCLITWKAVVDAKKTLDVRNTKEKRANSFSGN